MRALLARTLLLLALCSGAALAQKRGDRALITRQDLDEGATGLNTAFEAVQRLRPQWLRPPMGRNASAGMLDGLRTGEREQLEVLVYIDDQRQPAVEALRTVPFAQIVEMRYLDQNRAVQMLGPGHETGAILVTTINRRK